VFQVTEEVSIHIARRRAPAALLKSRWRAISWHALDDFFVALASSRLSAALVDAPPLSANAACAALASSRLNAAQANPLTRWVPVPLAGAEPAGCRRYEETCPAV